MAQGHRIRRRCGPQFEGEIHRGKLPAYGNHFPDGLGIEIFRDSFQGNRIFQTYRLLQSMDYKWPIRFLFHRISYRRIIGRIHNHFAKQDSLDEAEVQQEHFRAINIQKTNNKIFLRKTRDRSSSRKPQRWLV